MRNPILRLSSARRFPPPLPLLNGRGLMCPALAGQGHAIVTFEGVFFTNFLLTPHLDFWQNGSLNGRNMSSQGSRLREGYGGPREIREGQNN